ncbi:MAG: HTTM domain-containing protein [Cyclobacteriaceae bacterium]
MNPENLRYRLLTAEKSIAPLIIFRVLFGFLMIFSLVRFYLNGWITDQYLTPKLHFPYYGFEWVRNPGEAGIYLLFSLALIGATGILVGAFYRISAIVFFFSFTYLELIDKTNYLNHYYFVSLVAFLIIFLPLNGNFSIDVRRNPASLQCIVPAWMINIIKFQLAIVYCYAGIAKLNYDWLVEAMPLQIWLKAHIDFPLIGSLFAKKWVAYFFSWFGAAYDLLIVFFLINNRTRPFAYFFVISFHVLTWLLFPIGVFPWVMIAFSSIFLSDGTHRQLLNSLEKVFNFKSDSHAKVRNVRQTGSLVRAVFVLFVVFQLLFPWRYLLYPGDLFWNEQGFRFSWRVMLIEKAGYATFYVTDPQTGRRGQVANYEYLTPQQEKMMATQPDMIWQFANYLEEEYKQKGIEDPIINAEVYATLNGSRSRLLIDPTVDLTEVKDDFSPKSWITEAP